MNSILIFAILLISSDLAVGQEKVNSEIVCNAMSHCLTFHISRYTLPFTTNLCAPTVFDSSAANWFPTTSISPIWLTSSLCHLGNRRVCFGLMVWILLANTDPTSAKEIKFNRVLWSLLPVARVKWCLLHAKCRTVPNHRARMWGENGNFVEVIPSNSFHLNHFQCAEATGIPFQAVQDCVKSDHGVQLQLAAERKTQDVAYPNSMLRFVPTIVYNHRFDQGKQNRSLRDFRSVVCDELRAASYQLPQICLI